MRWLLALFLAACAPVPPPDVLAKLDVVREAPAAREAREHAPSAWAFAEQLRREANAAWEEGEDHATAQILAERAEVAYAHAVALARVARADRERVDAKAEGDGAERELAELDAEHQRVEADIRALELRLKVLRDAEPIAPSPEAHGAREQARAEAARALWLQGRLLCAAGELLAHTIAAERQGWQPPAELAAARAAERELAAQLGGAAAPIDGAMRVRAGCLQALTLVRRSDGGSAPAGADALLAELSEAGKDDRAATSSRDDRGVVVTLESAFAGEALDPAAEKRLAAIGAIARRHPGLPVLVVLHQAEEPDPAALERWRARGARVVATLEQASGRALAPAEIAGAAAPLVDPKGKHKSRNERIEVVLVTREAL